jgi:capsular exopolysaccharide synthesis family protein
MAEAGQRVVLVDADLRLPTVHTILNLPNSLGLSGVLNRGDTWDQVIQKTRRRNVWVITSGPTPSNPGALVGSARMRELMGQLSGWFDVVLVDSPALLAVADAAALATLVEAVILVVSRSQTRREAMQAASSELVGVQAKLLGLVVNRAEPSRDYGYYARTGDTPRQEGIEGDRSHGESRGQYVAS